MKNLKALATPNFIVHWMIAVGLFYFIFNTIENFYAIKLPFYGHPIDSRVIDSWCFFDASYVQAAKDGGYHKAKYYFSFLPIDLIFPVIYSALFWSCIRLIENKKKIVSVLSVFILVGACFDYLENLAFSIYLGSRLEIAALVSIFTGLKTIILIFNIVAASFAILHRAYLIFINKKTLTKARIQDSLIIVGVACIPLIIFYSLGQAALDDKIKVLTASAAAYFVVYKLMTGWLFINMTLKLAYERQARDSQHDHLAIFLTLSKGKIDSFWLQDIIFRISEIRNVTEPSDMVTIKPIGIIKELPEFPADNNRASHVLRKYGDYVISPEEETTFSGYTVVKKDMVISIEALVIGTRPFYGLESRIQKPISWQTSIVVLPPKLNL